MLNDYALFVFSGGLLLSAVWCNVLIYAISDRQMPGRRYAIAGAGLGCLAMFGSIAYFLIQAYA